MRQNDSNFFNRLIVAIKYNNIILTRFPKNNKIVVTILMIVVSIIISILSLVIALMMIHDSQDLEPRLYIGLIIYFFFVFEIALLAARHSVGAAEQLYNLSILPVSPIFRFIYLLAGSAFNIKSVVYCLFMLIITITFMFYNFYHGIISFLVLVLFFVLVNIFTVLIYLYCGRLFKRNNIIFPILTMLYFVPIWAYQLKIVSLERLSFYFNLPVIGWVADGLFATVNNQWARAITIIVLVVISSLIGIFLGKKRIEHSCDLIY